MHGAITDEQATQLKTVQRGGRHLLSLINDLLDLARIEAGKTELHPEALICQELLEEVTTALRPLAEEKGITLQLTPPKTPLGLFRDRRTLMQILLNLANNAIKFTDTGTVKLELDQHIDATQTTTCFAVIDTGRGITEKDQERLFTAFEQIRTTGAPAAEGTGLGLHIAQTLANLIHANITCESTPGQGSTFALQITTPHADSAPFNPNRNGDIHSAP